MTKKNCLEVVALFLITCGLLLSQEVHGMVPGKVMTPENIRAKAQYYVFLHELLELQKTLEIDQQQRALPVGKRNLRKHGLHDDCSLDLEISHILRKIEQAEANIEVCERERILRKKFKMSCRKLELEKRKNILACNTLCPDCTRSDTENTKPCGRCELRAFALERVLQDLVSFNNQSEYIKNLQALLNECSACEVDKKCEECIMLTRMLSEAEQLGEFLSSTESV